ncbi:MAG: hypothetical protein EHM32_04350 [Spirochaetales bacterium]|nr:MAG: hypothetical protein EHM32_04350 [Spirochaetales bacterium]
MRHLFGVALFCVLLVGDGRLQGEGKTLEPPMIPFRLLAGSRIEECTICAEKDMKKAFAMLGKEYPPAAVFSSTPDCGFIKTAECGNGEFVLSCCSAREPYEGPGGKKVVFPLLVFRFHSESEHLVGVAPGDFTALDIASKVASVKPGRLFDATIGVVPYRYGDGAAFNFSAKDNRLTVHCRVLKVALRP